MISMIEHLVNHGSTVKMRQDIVSRKEILNKLKQESAEVENIINKEIS